VLRIEPGRSAALPAGWTGAVEPGGGPVEVMVERARLARGAAE